jgi:hypothetical protein
MHGYVFCLFVCVFLCLFVEIANVQTHLNGIVKKLSFVTFGGPEKDRY